MTIKFVFSKSKQKVTIKVNATYGKEIWDRFILD